MSNDLEQKVIIITGASSGIGEATAYELGAACAQLVIAARRKTRLIEVAGRIAENGGKALVVETDIAKPWQAKRLINRTMSEYGRIDVLFNNAGWGSYAWFEQLKLEHIVQQFEVNVFGAIYLVHEALPIMMKQRSDRCLAAKAATVGNPRLPRSSQRRHRNRIQQEGQRARWANV